eukprot:3414037-Rhodomonas_salina.1
MQVRSNSTLSVLYHSTTACSERSVVSGPAGNLKTPVGRRCLLQVVELCSTVPTSIPTHSSCVA